MITVKRLKELLKDLPDEAKCYGYEGEDVGINIYLSSPFDNQGVWWIRASESDEEEMYTEGFEK